MSSLSSQGDPKVCALGSATLLLSVHLFLPHPEEQQEFDEPSPSSRFLALRQLLGIHLQRYLKHLKTLKLYCIIILYYTVLYN